MMVQFGSYELVILVFQVFPPLAFQGHAYG